MGLVNKGGRSFAFRLLHFGKVAGILSAAFFVCSTTPFSTATSSNLQFAVQDDSGPAPLNEKEKRKFRAKVAKINRRIRQEPCKDFLVPHLGEAIIDNISEKLAEHQAFSGPRSA